MKRIREILGKNVKQGSTMVGVLVAMTFVGIVVGAMVRSTGSQSAATVSHGVVMTMNSTVASGMVATESFFWNQGQRALDTLRSIMARQGGSFSSAGSNINDAFLFGTANSKTALASDQHFNSQLTRIRQDDDSTFFAQFEVNAGRTSGARSLRKASAFYQLENLKFEEENTFAGVNAMYLGGPLQDGNNGMIIRGHATYTKRFHSQNNKPLRFEPDSCGQGSVYFAGEFSSNNQNTVFRVPTYFNEQATFQNTRSQDSLFWSDVGFNGSASFSFSASPHIANIRNGNVWMNGRFRDLNHNFAVSNYIRNMEPDNGKHFYYTDAFGSAGTGTVLQPWEPTFCTQAPFGPPCPAGSISSSGKCAVDNCNAFGMFPPMPGPYCQPIGCTKSSALAQVPSPTMPGVTIPPGHFNQFNTSAANNPIRGFAEDKVTRSPTGGPWDIVNEMGMNDLPCRQEPDLNISKIDTSLYLSNAQAITCLNGGGVAPMSAAAMNTCMEDGSLPRYRDHIVIRWNPTVANAMTQVPSMPNTTFNGKVIFVVDAGVDNPFRGPIYNSSDSASTLVYVGPNGRLDQFGVGDNHNFRGLVYIDPANNIPCLGAANCNFHTLHWGDNSSISGAMLLKGQTRIGWNSGGDDNNKPTTVERDNDVLSNFASLVDCAGFTPSPVACNDQSCPPGSGGGGGCAGGGDATLELRNPSIGINTRPLGIYFH